MIHYLALKITDFLYFKKVISKEDREIYKYGYEIIISTIISFLIVVVFGIVSNKLWQTLLFFGILAITRTYSGGYHANTYFKCNFLLSIFLLIYLVLSDCLIKSGNISLIILMLILYITTILIYAPMENKNKKLDEDTKVKSRIISVSLSFFWSIVALVFYYIFEPISVAVTLTVFIVAITMLMNHLEEKRNGYN